MAAGDVVQGVGEEGLADTDMSDDGDVIVLFKEAQRYEFVEQVAVERDLDGLVPVSIRAWGSSRPRQARCRAWGGASAGEAQF